MSRFFVYGLIDPRTNEIFYVGKTCHGEKSVKRHSQPHSLRRSNNYKNTRIKEILNDGYELDYKILAKARNKRDVEIKERLIVMEMSREIELCNIQMNRR